ncbi:YceI family protein [Commensalibacter papalotli (ex Botero et al. 2024)]|uniref:Polyisoprenoid-binding periplasmic protein YceI (YceI) (PDB:1WUB) (PUBMED:15741337) n=1 Tax=Commensalibacter papalotli (ex Botero et al. 2024) TaxID=2972766 RepID=A0ABM9HM18_9PROT|nr:YceI family protein [Commensalibacter papalotli (ex Botero et al. 2024)]CAI3935738.1 Polyisoprenoid-binding periplasmic protein YceI (YceI) (PDB:1WUB) (PUBMED:15741337 [Commensalibacter papalotli (ex Botero et al. 2024)]CAI3951898.1 Polyisoprenoid-binding periplasmic protein YceI (YceI) (PDB:1WUB) (PUBMED:15741337 [Commensalibacter papalotli (ex Botero et al. 2024)]
MNKVVIGLLGATALFFATEGAHAAPQQITDTVITVQNVKNGNYKIDPYHTQVLFSVSHFGFTNYSGNFSDISGVLALNPKNIEKSKLDIQIPIASIQTTSSKLTQELKDPDWFDAKQYPTAHFVSSHIVKTGEKTADVTGNLTLHGITKPVTLHIAYIGAGVNPLNKAYTVGFQITGKINRGEFGIKTYLPKVGDEVDLTIAAAFEKAS